MRGCADASDYGGRWPRDARYQATMEINVEHPLLKRLDEEADEDRFADLAQILLDQAVLAEGSTLEDPACMLRGSPLLVEMSDA